ncbi:hypothetical protein [Streptomyces lunaelactis]|nr:hypothetical protein [Streptomyces lunaelactis]
MYDEALRQLTLDFEESRSQMQQNAAVTDLASPYPADNNHLKQ